MKVTTSVPVPITGELAASFSWNWHRDTALGRPYRISPNILVAARKGPS